MGMLDNRVALITGGGSGLGRACAIAFAGEGALVALTDIALDAADDTVAAITRAGGTAIAIRSDAADRLDCEEAVRRVVERFGRLDAAVNNAGIITGYAGLDLQSDADWERQIAINLSGVRHAMRFELRAMLQAGGGSIINISSVAGLKGTTGASAYCAAKHGVIGLTRATALDHAAQGIRINAICPGYIETPIHAARIAEGKARDIKALSPMGRPGQPGEIADAAVWLASDRSSFVTGIALPVDGGSFA